MNEEIEYAEMLEIPVSTVNVARKPRRRKKTREELNPIRIEPNLAEENNPSALKDAVIAQVNDRLETQADEETPLQASSDGELRFDPEPELIPDRIDTVRLYSTSKSKRFWKKKGFYADEYAWNEYGNDVGRYATNDEKHASKGFKIALGAEFALACALCGAIFLTNVLMPNSAINTFFRTLSGTTAQASQTDERTYTDFILSPVVSGLSDAELTLSETGVLTFSDACCVYPTADGKVAEITRSETGEYTVKIAYSSTFTGVFNGLDQVYYEIGDVVKANVPFGYTDGETEVQVTMYSDGVLLNCFELTDENCLAWNDQTAQ